MRLWETVQKLAKTIYKPKLLAVKKQRKFIAVDETVIKMNREKRFLWAAIDVESREVLAVWVTTTRNYWIAREFILVVLNSCEGGRFFWLMAGLGTGLLLSPWGWIICM